MLHPSIGYAANVEKVELNLEKDEIAFTFLELSTGEATLIQTSTGKNILINTGGPNTSKELLDRLEMYDVLKIDMLILTRRDKQYSSNVKWLNQSYMIDKFVIPESMKDYIIDKFELNMNSLITWNKGNLYELSPNFVVKVLHDEHDDEKEKGGFVLLFTYGAHQLLYMSTIDEKIEQEILEYPVKAKMLKVGEFALPGGTSQPFLEKINPQLAVIFHKKNARPSQEIIERLNETWIDIYQTKQFGNVTIKCDLESYEVITIPVGIE